MNKLKLVINLNIINISSLISFFTFIFFLFFLFHTQLASGQESNTSRLRNQNGRPHLHNRPEHRTAVRLRPVRTPSTPFPIINPPRANRPVAVIREVIETLPIREKPLPPPDNSALRPSPYLSPERSLSPDPLKQSPAGTAASAHE